jgi:hypothetical protein
MVYMHLGFSRTLWHSSTVKSVTTNGFAKYHNDDLLTHAIFPLRAADPSDIISAVTFLIEMSS